MKDLTILGRGPSWKECPFRTNELWGTVTCLTVEELRDRPFTKVFAFDGIESAVEGINIAKERKIPVVSNREYATERYPLVEIAREFQSSYFMPSISYMLAYALYLKYERLYIYGIDQGPRWDYQSGKPHIVFWLGVATGRKVDLRIGKGSLRWAYRMGLDEMPLVMFENAENAIANNIGKTIRSEELEYTIANLVG